MPEVHFRPRLFASNPRRGNDLTPAPIATPPPAFRDQVWPGTPFDKLRAGSVRETPAAHRSTWGQPPQPALSQAEGAVRSSESWPLSPPPPPTPLSLSTQNSEAG